MIKGEKIKDQIQKVATQKKHPRTNHPKIWVYTNHLIFLKELSTLQNLHFPLKDYMNGYFWLSLEEHFLQAFFPVSFFLRQKRKYTAKKPRRNTVYENSTKVRRNTSPQERWKNYGKHGQSLTNIVIGKVEMLANTQNSIIINKGKDLKISKSRLTRCGVKAVYRANEKSSSTIWIVGEFDIGQLRCGTSLVQYFGSLKFPDK